MRRLVLVVLLLAGWLAAAPLLAQAPAGGDAAATGQSKPAGEGQKPATGAAQPGKTSSANPFPEDTSSVPVMPTKTAPALPEGTYGAADAGLPLPGEDLDPVRSPDDAAPTAASGPEEDSSSSLTGLESLLPKPEDDESGKKRKLSVKEPTHQEAASKDIEVGGFYLDQKNWRAALSRFESAMVLDPENPDVYWGLAEANRHLGNFADARANYQKAAEYDPDSRHGKEAIKVLKEPEIANGKNAAPGQPATEMAK
ncbi:MAG: tetratricopeptide repeat protein [Terracidiphilus sp.]